jgi:hypothetical protein
MVRIPTSVFAVEWALLFGLAALVVVLYRQLAYLMKLREPGPIQGGLDIGETAPAFTYRPMVASNGRTRESFEPGGDSTLLVFADPYCGTCAELIRAVEQLPWEAKDIDLRLVVATTATRERVTSLHAFESIPGEVALIKESVMRRLYRVPVTPYVFVIDGTGVIQARGTARTNRELLEMINRAPRFDAADRLHASVPIARSAMPGGHAGPPHATADSVPHQERSVR